MMMMTGGGGKGGLREDNHMEDARSKRVAEQLDSAERGI
jgi:hypothetical protein